MAKNQNDLAGRAPANESGGWLSRFLADERMFDRHTLWRLGSWGATSVGAVIIALLAHNSGAGLRHEQSVAADLARQSQQLRSIAKANENEVRRLSSAISTLNSDRDRLFARVTVLEQALDSVTGSISRNVAQNGPRRASSRMEATLGLPPVEAPLLPHPNPTLPSPAGLTPLLASTATVKLSSADPSPADSLSASANGSSMTSPSASPAMNPSAAIAAPVTPNAAPKPATVASDPPATRVGRPDEKAAVTPAKSAPEKDGEPHKSKGAGRKDAQIVTAIPAAADTPQGTSLHSHIPVAHTDFGVDLGSARSIKGLRALWRSILKSEAKELTSLYPIIVLKERSNGSGIQMRLVAGPLADAAAAAKICAVLSENGRTCETAVFDGQRLATNEHSKESDTAVTTKKPGSPHASSRHRHSRKPVHAEAPASPPSPPPPPQPKPSPFGSFFSH